MNFRNLKKSELDEVFNNLEKYLSANFEPQWVKYVDLGVKIVRLVNYSKNFTPHVERQLTYSLKDNSERFDATLVIWHEKDIENLAKTLYKENNPKYNLRLRVELLASKGKMSDLRIFDDHYDPKNPIVSTNLKKGIFEALNKDNNTYYYGVENLEPEEFIKQGHIFVQQFNQILKTPKTNLVHGAAIGLNDNGILLCARGQRGKSTLAVLSMIKGFEYVSDDYLVLEREGDELFTYPIYSIITLSPRMYNELYDELDGTRFVSNNARKDKYVINIEKFHNQFKTKYPIKVCMFPEIVEDKEPSITKCKDQEKGRAIVHIVHSTIKQMRGHNDIKTVQKLMNMVKDFDFYRINLCSDIYKNTECLRKFAQQL